MIPDDGNVPGVYQGIGVTGGKGHEIPAVKFLLCPDAVIQKRASTQGLFLSIPSDRIPAARYNRVRKIESNDLTSERVLKNRLNRRGIDTVPGQKIVTLTYHLSRLYIEKRFRRDCRKNGFLPYPVIIEFDGNMAHKSLPSAFSASSSRATPGAYRPIHSFQPDRTTKVRNSLSGNAYPVAEVPAIEGAAAGGQLPGYHGLPVQAFAPEWNEC